MLFIDKLVESVKRTGNPSVVGLDPKIEYVPDFIKKPIYEKNGISLISAAQSICKFNKLIIDSIYDVVAIVKPQIAYYEMYGVEGLQAFYETIRYAREKGLIVIGDCKRNDIGSTASCYAKAFLGKTQVENEFFEAFPLDAITVNPYLGDDTIIPFLDECTNNERGIFILVKTSNPTSSQFQDISTKNEKKVYEIVAENVREHAERSLGETGYSNIGAVVGATYPVQAIELRKIMKKSFFLVPGYGAQGAKGKDIAPFFNEDGMGAIINSSRTVLLAYQKENNAKSVTMKEFIDKTKTAVLEMREDILRTLS